MVSGSPATASIAATRPDMTAGPIGRARMPPKVSVVIRTPSWAARAAASAAEPMNAQIGFMGRSVPFLLLLGRFYLRHGEGGIGNVHVHLNLVDGQRLAVRGVLGLVLDRVRKEHAGDLLVVADSGLELYLLVRDLRLALALELEVGLGVEVEVAVVAVLLGDLELVGLGSLDRLLARDLDLVALLLVVPQLAVEVGLVFHLLEVISGHLLGVLLAHERHHHPAGGAVVGLHAGHPLEGELQPNPVGPFPLQGECKLPPAARFWALTSSTVGAASVVVAGSWACAARPKARPAAAHVRILLRNMLGSFPREVSLCLVDAGPFSRSARRGPAPQCTVRRAGSFEAAPKRAAAA